jgi:hypothetical protein
VKVIDHGWWRQYEPERPPSYAPPTAVFIRREGDNVDWYDYVRPSDPNYKSYFGFDHTLKPNFEARSLKCNVYKHPELGCDVIGTAVYDPTTLFPNGQRIIEIIGFEGDDPHTEFGGKVYDDKIEIFSALVRSPPPPSPLEQKILDRLDAITARLEKLERKTNG